MRIWMCLAAVVIGGLVVLSKMGLAPDMRPGWYGFVITLVALAMCWGGVEAARWMLRESPIAKLRKPQSDWARLWLWSGVPSGVLMLFWLVVSSMLKGLLSPQVMIMFIGIAIMGPMLWILATPWIVRDVVGMGRLPASTVLLLSGGLVLHALGAAFAYWFFPHFSGMSLRLVWSLLSSLASCYGLAFFHLLLIGCVWSAVSHTSLWEKLRQLDEKY